MKRYTVSKIENVVFLCEISEDDSRTYKIINEKEFEEAKKLLNIT